MKNIGFRDVRMYFAVQTVVTFGKSSTVVLSVAN